MKSNWICNHPSIYRPPFTWQHTHNSRTSIRKGLLLYGPKKHFTFCEDGDGVLRFDLWRSIFVNKSRFTSNPAKGFEHFESAACAKMIYEIHRLSSLHAPRVQINTPQRLHLAKAPRRLPRSRVPQGLCGAELARFVLAVTTARRCGDIEFHIGKQRLFGNGKAWSQLVSN